MLTRSQIKSLINALKNDEIVVMPTDTIYGLSAKNSLLNQSKINQLKRAPLTKPLITLISNEQQLSTLVALEKYAQYSTLMNQGVTLIFPNRQNKKKTIAVRWVKRPDLIEVINYTGPLWSSSLNYHGQEIIRDFKMIKSTFSDVKIFNDQTTLEGQPSKIYDTLNHKWLR